MTTTYPTRSRVQLVDKALRILDVVPNGQTPDADDRAVVDDYVDLLLARLDGEGITTIDNPDAIPAAQFIDVAILLANDAKSEFGLAALPLDDPMKSEVRLRTVTSVPVTTETVTDVDDETGENVTYTQAETLHGSYF